MSTIDRWRKWCPPDEKFRESLTFEPPKPPELVFGGFGGHVSRQRTNFYDTPPSTIRRPGGNHSADGSLPPVRAIRGFPAVWVAFMLLSASGQLPAMTFHADASPSSACYANQDSK
jgi:hypothetical protein